MSAIEGAIEAPFAAIFPLPFRVILLGGLGILCWATNLHGLHILGVNVADALEIGIHDGSHSSLSRRSTFLDSHGLASSVYRLFYLYSIWGFFTWATFRYCTGGGGLDLVDVYKFIPGVAGLVIICALVSPFNYMEKRERDRFLLAIRRCCFSPTSMPVFFCDVILADIFTSFAKIIGDVWLSFCMIGPGGSLLMFPRQSGWYKLVVPILMSVPYAIRFRQCIIEFMQSDGSTRRPFYNALKYASSFPVIFLSAAQRDIVSSLVAENNPNVSHDAWHGEHPLFRLWLLSVVINSLYSFWWDISNDWGLDLLRRKTKVKKPSLRPLVLPSLHSHTSSDDSTIHARHTSHLHSNGSIIDHSHSDSNASHHGIDYPWGLRPTLLFPLPFYPLAVFFNLILRFTWSFKLSSHLHSHAHGAVIIFWIEVAEMIRRWMWVFFRVEWECIKRGTTRSSLVHDSLEMDDALFDEEAKVGSITSH